VKKIFPLIFLMLSVNIANSQTASDYFPKLAVTVKPIGFFDPFLTNFTGGVQYRFRDKLMVEIQGGLIHSWYCTYNQKEEDISKKGWKAGVEVKYLLYKRMYAAVQLFHNNYTKTNEESVWRYGRSYTQDMNLDKKISSVGGHLKFGVFLYRPERRLFLDCFAGIGMRNRKIELQSLPEDVELIEEIDMFGPDIFDNDESGTRNYPSVELGFSIGFRLLK